MKNSWRLHSAKNRFSEVIEQALSDGPQHVTRRGKPAVVVLSERDYARLTQREGTLADFLSAAPLKGIDLTRAKDVPRDVDL